MELYTIRHAQSTAQTGEGEWLDPDLSAFGERQAAAAAGFFTDKAFDLALISPLRRARRTFELSSPTVEVARFDSRLVECTLDRGPGYDYRAVLPYETPDTAEPDTADMWTEPAGRRIASLLETLRQHSAERVLLVAHTGILNVLRSHLVGDPIVGEPTLEGMMSAHHTDNTAVHCFVVGKTHTEDRLVFWNRRTNSL